MILFKKIFLLKRKCFMLIVSLFLFSANSYAILPVFDGAAFAKLIEQFQQLKTQYDLLKDTYKNAQQQLDKAKQLVSDAEGHYGFGSLGNNELDLKQREWSPNNWQDALKGLSGGNPQRYNQLLEEYKKNNKTLSDEEYKKGASEEKTKAYKQETAVNKAATVQASYAFNDINNHLKNVHQLSSKIEEARNTKAAIDLNSRITAELAYISIQELKMQSVMNQQLAQEEAGRIHDLSQSAKFNALPNNENLFK